MSRCANCRKSLRGKRGDAQACSAACRQALYRKRSDAAPVAGLVAMWNELHSEYGDDLTVKLARRVLRNRLERIRRERQAQEDRAARLAASREETCDSCGVRHGDEHGWRYRIVVTDPPGAER